MNPEFTNRFSGRWFGKYKAKVTNNQDPKQRNRLRLYIPAVHKFTVSDGSTAQSGWSWPISTGVYATPEVGDIVWVEFEEGDIERPLWIPGLVPIVEDEFEGVVSGSPKHARGKYDLSDVVDRVGENSYDTTVETSYGSDFTSIELKDGTRVELDSTDGASRILIHHNSGSRFEILDDGTVLENSQGNRGVTTRGAKTEVISGPEFVISETGTTREFKKSHDLVEDGRRTHINSSLVEEVFLSYSRQTERSETISSINRTEEVSLNRKTTAGGDIVISSGGVSSVVSAGGLFNIAGSPASGVKVQAMNPVFSANLIKGPYQPEGVPFVFPGANVFSVAANSLVSLPGAAMYSSITAIPTSIVHAGDAGISLLNLTPAGVGSGILISGGVTTIGSNALLDVPPQLLPQPLVKISDFEQLRVTLTGLVGAIVQLLTPITGGAGAALNPFIPALQTPSFPTTTLLAQ